MSFICPNCGYRDDLKWRNRLFDSHAQIMALGDFKIAFPEISEIIENGESIHIPPYAYKLTGKREGRMMVVRITEDDWKARKALSPNGKGFRRPETQSRYPGHAKRLWHDNRQTNLTVKPDKEMRKP